MINDILYNVFSNFKGKFMIVDRIITVPLDKKSAAKYATCAYEEYAKKRAAKVRCLGGGSFGIAYKVISEDGESIVVKFMRADNMMQKEVFDLRLLRKSCPLEMPKVLFSRDKDDKIPVDCYGMTVMQGKPLLSSLCSLLSSERKRRAIGEKIVDALHEIHGVKNAKFGDTLNPDCDTWLEYYKPFAKQVLDKAVEFEKKGELSKEIINTMKTAWQKFDIIFEEKVEDACLIHGDLNIMNILKCGDKISFIDPLNSMYADREYDLFQFDNLYGKRFFLSQIYRKKYGESRRCDDKLAFYGLWNEVFCVIKAGTLIPFIMNPLVKNMKKSLETL